ncbi:hypothetical protein LAZ67_10001110 [Cordylochernes scorpioides]|uniref:Uncharacterized protein n=1 Tax=Cordylochernes scorpioides TaxID=51811 RepID=A0ABY6KX77_9ARAC|nr:hypothetical protein LAZ67_10001110 [Cordylochernes scorpioides]
MIKTKRRNFLRSVQRLFFLESSENHPIEDLGKELYRNEAFEGKIQLLSQDQEESSSHLTDIDHSES